MSLVIEAGITGRLLQRSANEKILIESLAALTEAVDSLALAQGGSAQPPAGPDGITAPRIEMRTVQPRVQ